MWQCCLDMLTLSKRTVVYTASCRRVLKTMYFVSLLNAHIIQDGDFPSFLSCQSTEPKTRRIVIVSRPDRSPRAVILVICVVPTKSLKKMSGWCLPSEPGSLPSLFCCWSAERCSRCTRQTSSCTSVDISKLRSICNVWNAICGFLFSSPTDWLRSVSYFSNMSVFIQAFLLNFLGLTENQPYYETHLHDGVGCRTLFRGEYHPAHLHDGVGCRTLFRGEHQPAHLHDGVGCRTLFRGEPMSQ